MCAVRWVQRAGVHAHLLRRALRATLACGPACGPCGSPCTLLGGEVGKRFAAVALDLERAQSAVHDGTVQPPANLLLLVGLHVAGGLAVHPRGDFPRGRRRAGPPSYELDRVGLRSVTTTVPARLLCSRVNGPTMSAAA